MTLFISLIMSSNEASSMACLVVENFSQSEIYQVVENSFFQYISQGYVLSILHMVGNLTLPYPFLFGTPCAHHRVKSMQHLRILSSSPCLQAMVCFVFKHSQNIDPTLSFPFLCMFFGWANIFPLSLHLLCSMVSNCPTAIYTRSSATIASSFKS